MNYLGGASHPKRHLEPRAEIDLSAKSFIFIYIYLVYFLSPTPWSLSTGLNRRSMAQVVVRRNCNAL